jgi:hypothetical protein
MSPSRSSITIHGVPVASSTPAPSTSTTLSLSMRVEIFASARKRARRSASRTSPGSITFIARCLPVESCSTTYTAPMPPCARGRTMR